MINKKKHRLTLASVSQLVGASSLTPKGCRFDSQSGHIPRFWVQSLVGVQMCNQSLSLSLSLSPFLSLLSSLLQINKHILKIKEYGFYFWSPVQDSDTNQKS